MYVRLMYFTEAGSSKPIIIAFTYLDGKPMAFIGTGTGVNKKDDLQRVVERGDKFPIEAAEALFPEAKEATDDEFIELDDLD